jgi:catechol 2,3-dioxygenase-like lactoylglutathione lyase family enzyme
MRAPASHVGTHLGQSRQAPLAANEDERGCRPPFAAGSLSEPGYTVPGMDWKIELVAIPVTDVDRAKAFYVDQGGFHADHDHQVNEALRFVQLTQPGSACSIVMGAGITDMAPGSQKAIQMVVADVAAARQQLIAHGVAASDVDVQPWGSFVTFSDPDGNTWALQQLPAWR